MGLPKISMCLLLDSANVSGTVLVVAIVMMSLQLIASEYLTAENHSSSAHVHLTVVSVVESSPYFAQNVYTATLDAVATPGTHVIDIKVGRRCYN